jgi:hypothetical protein
MDTLLVSQQQLPLGMSPRASCPFSDYEATIAVYELTKAKTGIAFQTGAKTSLTIG